MVGIALLAEIASRALSGKQVIANVMNQEQSKADGSLTKQQKRLSSVSFRWWLQVSNRSRRGLLFLRHGWRWWGCMDPFAFDCVSTAAPSCNCIPLRRQATEPYLHLCWLCGTSDSVRRNWGTKACVWWSQDLSWQKGIKSWVYDLLGWPLLLKKMTLVVCSLFSG